MSAETDHHHDSDARLKSLDTRVSALEERVHDMDRRITDNTRELQANTALTRQIHESLGRVNETLNGRDDDEEDSGLHGKVNDMHQVFADFAGTKRTVKRFFWPVVGTIGAVAVWWKTGEFKWPQLPG